MIHQLFEKLASNNSRKFKEDLLSQHKDNELVKRVVQLACDPAINFYQKKIPSYAPRLDSGTRGLSWALTELEALTNRSVTGSAAIEHLTMILENVSADDGEVIKRIINKDLRCGVSDSTANKVWKGLIPEYCYMRCQLPKNVDLTKFSWKDGVYSQEKADGLYAAINVFADKGVSILTRSGSEFPMDKFVDLADEIKNTISPDTQTHGEMLVKRGGEVLPREIGNGILNSILKGGDWDTGDEPVLLVWDQIPLNEVIPGNKYKVPYAKRYAYLNQQLNDDNTPDLIQMIPTHIVHTMDDAMTHYQEMLSAGKEGTIIKNGTAIWEDTTSKNQVKLKLSIAVDLVILGFTDGKGKNANTFGSVTCGTSDGELIVNVSGFKDKKQKGILTRQEVWDMRDQLIGTIMTVTSNSLMKPTKSNPKYSLFLPRCTELRADKKNADTIQQVIEQFDNAIKS